MAVLRKIAFLLEDLSRLSPAQQLLDRFLIGYSREGVLHKPECKNISAHLMLGAMESGLERRSRDFGLTIAHKPGDAVEGADAVVIVPRKPGGIANERFLQIALERASAGAAVFVYGALSNSLARGRGLAR